MKSQAKPQPARRTLPTELQSQGAEAEQQGDSLLPLRNFYDTFAFRDRITNNRFQYRQARENRLPLKVLEWQAPEADEGGELKNSLNVYKFTKKFEINCIRSKYLRQSHSENGLGFKENHCKTAGHAGEGNKLISKETLFQINKQEMKRVLETNDRVNQDILELNRSRRYLPFHLKGKHMKKGALKWRVIENAGKEHESMMYTQGEAERRITEKIINHMKHQIKSNCEYLLNMPTEKKKQALFKNQLKRHLEYHKTSFPNYSHSEIEPCKFSTLQTEENATLQPEEILSKFESQSSNLLRFVKMGFINQVYLQLQNNPYYCMAKDEQGNNVYHIAAREGNTEMAKNLLKVIAPRNTLRLLCDRNHMKRTPHDKAQLLGHRDISALFSIFTAQNKHIIC